MVLAAGTFCTAGTIRHDRNDADYRAYAAQPQFAAVGSYSAGSVSGSFTLISPNWALTAAHVVDTNKNGDMSDEVILNDRLTVGGVVRYATEVIVPTAMDGTRGWNGNINAGFDIALVRLSQPITTITPARIYTGFQELGKIITSVGYGQTGDGTTGAYKSSGTKRAGDNVVDSLINFSNGATGLRWDFDEPSPRVSRNDSGSSTPLDLEYLIAPGDSGGGSFLFENGQWWLAGVHSGTYPAFDYPGANNNTATYGDAALITRVAAYQEFIHAHVHDLALVSIPEPAHLTLLAATSLLALRRRRI